MSSEQESIHMTKEQTRYQIHVCIEIKTYRLLSLCVMTVNVQVRLN